MSLRHLWQEEYRLIHSDCSLNNVGVSRVREVKDLGVIIEESSPHRGLYFEEKKAYFGCSLKTVYIVCSIMAEISLTGLFSCYIFFYVSRLEPVQKRFIRVRL